MMTAGNGNQPVFGRGALGWAATGLEQSHRLHRAAALPKGHL